MDIRGRGKHRLRADGRDISRRPWLARLARSLTVFAALLIFAGAVMSSIVLATAAAASSTGPVYDWGANGSGELGDGGTPSSSLPVLAELPSGEDATSVAAGDSYSLALTSDGKVYAWGANSEGQLGDGTTIERTIPVAVTLPADVTVASIAAGTDTSFAVTTTGAVYAWGDNSQGEFGNDSTTSSATPELITTMPAPVKQIAVGEYFATYALTTAGDVYAWGNNFDGEIGDGTDGAGHNSTVPVEVDLGGETATAVAGGGGYGMALGSNGDVYLWGYLGPS
jgi:alpha-tubulin suppressor-like RCC1 family protein